ncbi:MAG: selenide, water dikinase SelD [Deltaproteobacteria bacterium]|nr:selenide, water dikinase SelD [Deltaproteobacteria bacterium]
MVWATGAAPHDVLRAPAVATDPRGFALVDDHLALLGHPDVFAAGDCAVPAAATWVPRAGVYAVRAGGVLAHNLAARAAGRPLLTWRPQRDFLTLLNLGDGAAVASKWGLVAAGPAMMRWKDRIDRRFVERFRVLADDGALAPGVAPMAGADAMVCGGCAAKLGRTELERALARLAAPLADPSVVLGAADGDDAAAVALPGGDTVVASVDAFRAFCDDDFLVGRVAAVNALTDLHAKGAVPRWALANVTLREDDPAAAREDALVQVLAGARAALDPLGVALVGGHTTVGPELAVGFAVFGALPGGAAPLALRGFAPGDRLLLAKPLGTGALLAAHRQGLAAGPWVDALEAALVTTQDEVMALARAHGVAAATDITGFGLAGHALEAAEKSGVTLALHLDALPALPGALAVLRRGIRSTFHPDNARAARALLIAPDAAAHPALDLLFDPQTAGGLLLAAPADRADALLAALRAGPAPEAAEIGVVGSRGAAPVVVTA